MEALWATIFFSGFALEVIIRLFEKHLFLDFAGQSRKSFIPESLGKLPPRPESGDWSYSEGRLHASDPPRRVSGIPLLSPPVGRQPPFSKSLNAAFSTGAGFVVVRRLKRGGATQGCWRMTRTYPNWRNSPQESSSAAKKCRVTNKNHLVTNIWREQKKINVLKILSQAYVVLTPRGSYSVG